ncbi:hypothetical protein [Streptomyces lydicus]|uniref:hypothetical protein n=1 Tax=Streptomyces TaxID=1883 RepID=UPI00344850B2
MSVRKSSLPMLLGASLLVAGALSTSATTASAAPVPGAAKVCSIEDFRTYDGMKQMSSKVELCAFSDGEKLQWGLASARCFISNPFSPWSELPECSVMSSYLLSVSKDGVPLDVKELRYAGPGTYRFTVHLQVKGQSSSGDVDTWVDGKPTYTLNLTTP